MVAPLAFGGIAAGSAILGAAGQLKAGRQAKKAAKRQSELAYQTRMEEMRRANLGFINTMKQAKGAAYASGVQVNGSTGNYLTSMRDEFSKELAWMKKSAALERRAIRKGGSGLGTGFAAASTALAGFGQAYSIYKGG